MFSRKAIVERRFVKSKETKHKSKKPVRKVKRLFYRQKEPLIDLKNIDVL